MPRTFLRALTADECLPSVCYCCLLPAEIEGKKADKRQPKRAKKSEPKNAELPNKSELLAIPQLTGVSL